MSYKLYTLDNKFIEETNVHPRHFTGIVVYEGGTKEWRVNGKVHRLDGPAWEGVDGTREWFVNDRRHRLDGPAVEDADGTKQWWVDGKRHRLDGPAAERKGGSKAWFVEGKETTKEQCNLLYSMMKLKGLI